MALSNKTIQQLAVALAPEVVAYIFESEEWVTFMHDMVPDAVNATLGTVDEDIQYELSLAIMDRICIKSAS